MRTMFTFFFLAAASSSSFAGGADVITDYAEKAIAKGYGTTCSLDMQPSVKDGYYPCIDFGPYRFVRQYQKVSAYVIFKDQQPFQVLGGSPSNPEFIVGGPWEQNMPARVVMFWNDVVEGGAAKARTAIENSKRKSDAEAYIRAQMGEEKHKNTAADPPETAFEKPGTISTDKLIETVKPDTNPIDVDHADIRKIMSGSNVN